MELDLVSIGRLKQLHPLVRLSAIEAYTEACELTPKGIHPFITETSRSFKRSDELYAQGRTKKGSIVTNAKGGDSIHNYDMAIDFVILINGKMSWKVDKNWLIVVECFKQRGWIWGADWDNDGKTKAQGDTDEKLVDAPHLQNTAGYTLKELKAKFAARDFIEGNRYLNI